MKATSISAFLLLATIVSLATAAKLRSHDQSTRHLESTPSSRCPGTLWTPNPTKPRTFDVKWCYNDAGCLFSKDYITVSCFNPDRSTATSFSITISANGVNAITLIYSDTFNSVATDQKMGSNTVIKIDSDSCTNGPWKSKLCDSWYAIRLRRDMKWVEIADKLSLYVYKGTLDRDIELMR